MHRTDAEVAHIVAPAVPRQAKRAENRYAHVSAVGMPGKLQVETDCRCFISNIGAVRQQEAKVVIWRATQCQPQIRLPIPVIINPRQQQPRAIALDQPVAIN